MGSFAYVLLPLLVQTGPRLATFDVDGVTRQAHVYAPTKAIPKEGAPVVFGFHGHGGNMRNAARSFEMHVHWPEAIVVYPQGLPTKTPNDPDGRRPGWQIIPSQDGRRDLKFFDATLAWLKKNYQVDDSRIYSMGHSNGGRFTYVLWAARPDVFAAYGPSASPATSLINQMEPRPAFILAGERDKIVSFESQLNSINALKEKYGCPEKPVSKKGHLEVFKGSTGVELATYIYPGTHAYAKEANPLMVDFFKRHRKS